MHESCPDQELVHSACMRAMLIKNATLEACVQVANPPLVGVLSGIAVGLTPVGSVLFDPAGATAQVFTCDSDSSDLPLTLL